MGHYDDQYEADVRRAYEFEGKKVRERFTEYNDESLGYFREAVKQLSRRLDDVPMTKGQRENIVSMMRPIQLLAGFPK